MRVLGLSDVVETAERERLRRRMLSFAGLWVLLGGLVAALGFGALVLQATLVMLVVGSAAGVVLGLSRGRVQRRFRLALGRIRPSGRRLRSQLDELELPRRLEQLGNRAGVSSRRGFASFAVNGAATSRRARVALGHGGRRSESILQKLVADALIAGRAGARTLSELSARTSNPPARQRQAVRLNTLGAQLRRQGEHERAADQHRAALAIVRDLGDEHTEALTLNNLALAVVHTDGIAAAVEHFEQALVVLRHLGDEEHEGRVIANLGFIHRSHGSSEEADGLLHAALDKLPTDSRAYRKVEEQLRRAS